MPQTLNGKIRVLDAAEKNFAEFGFDAASMKVISQDAGVAQGLLHYHFDSKEGLYRAVIGRRAAAITEMRLDMLDAVDLGAEDAVEKVFLAFLKPPLDSAKTGLGSPQLMARLIGGGALARDLIEEHYDECAQRFIEVLSELLPGASRPAVAQSYVFATGALIACLTPHDRMTALSADAQPCAKRSAKQLERMVRFCAAGIRALA